MSTRREFLKLGGAAAGGIALWEYGPGLLGGDDDTSEEAPEGELVMGEPVQDTVELGVDNGSEYEGFKQYEIKQDAEYIEYSVAVAEDGPYIDVFVMEESEFSELANANEADYFEKLSEHHTHNAHERGQLPDIDDDYRLVIDNTTRGPTDPDGDKAVVEVEYVTGTYEPTEGSGNQTSG